MAKMVMGQIHSVTEETEGDWQMSGGCNKRDGTEYDKRESQGVFWNEANSSSTDS